MKATGTAVWICKYIDIDQEMISYCPFKTCILQTIIATAVKAIICSMSIAETIHFSLPVAGDT